MVLTKTNTIFGISIHVIFAFLALIIAIRCNPGKLLIPIVAVLFPELYLIQFGVRKYILQEAICQ